MTLPNASKHRGSAARVRRDAAPGLPDAMAAAAGTPGRKAMRQAASGFRERKRVILNLLRAVRSGRLRSADELGAWGEALLAARLIADAAAGLSLTCAGREMLIEMSLKHEASTAAPTPPGPADPAFLLIARGRSRSVGERDAPIEQNETIASS